MLTSISFGVETVSYEFLLVIMQDFMSGKTLFRNILGIVLPGVNFLITERTNQIYGQLIEKAVQLSLEIVILVMEKDSTVSDFWRPLYQVFIANSCFWSPMLFKILEC